jgi:hypothetical protein
MVGRKVWAATGIGRRVELRHARRVVPSKKPACHRAAILPAKVNGLKKEGCSLFGVGNFGRITWGTSPPDLLGFFAFGPAGRWALCWVGRLGWAKPARLPFRLLSRRSGRVPAEPYPPLRRHAA